MIVNIDSRVQNESPYTMPSPDVIFMRKPNCRHRFCEICDEEQHFAAITNMADIACALHRQPEHIVNFLRYTLHLARASYDFTKGQCVLDKIYYGRRCPNRGRILDAIQQFIETDVLCQACRSPDTTLDFVNCKLRCHTCGNEECRKQRCRILNITTSR